MTGKRTCIHGRTERQVCRKCDDMDRAALHPVSDATPDLALYDLPALASEPVPATPACICGRAVPVAGTCFDIDGAYWSGHGEPVPATGNPEETWLSISEAAALPKDHPGLWACVCGTGWLGEARGYPDDLRDHAVFRVSGGEPGSAHDPGLARFRPDIIEPATGNPEGHETADPFEWECGDIHCPHHGIARFATGNPEEIDVEALARALHACEHPAVPDCRLGLNVEPRPEWAGRRKCEVDAERIAAEYARQREGERP